MLPWAVFTLALAFHCSFQRMLGGWGVECMGLLRQTLRGWHLGAVVGGLGTKSGAVRDGGYLQSGATRRSEGGGGVRYGVARRKKGRRK